MLKHFREFINQTGFAVRALAGRYDNPIPNRFLALIDCYKIPAQIVLNVHHAVYSMYSLTSPRLCAWLACWLCELAESLLLLVAWLACRWLFFLLFIRLMQGSITVNILIATASHPQLSSTCIPSQVLLPYVKPKIVFLVILSPTHPILNSHRPCIPSKCSSCPR
jgi:hypothetical protein